MNQRGMYEHPRDVEWPFLPALDNLYYWLTSHMTDREFIENVRIVVGQICDNQWIINKMFDDLVGNHSWRS